MKKIKVELNLTKREVATIKDIGMTPKEYVQSIVHYDLDKIMLSEVVDDIDYEKSPDRNLL
jgi:hypothetical protein